MIPAVLMVVTTMAALVYYLYETSIKAAAAYLLAGNVPYGITVLILTDLLLLALSVGVIMLSVKKAAPTARFRQAPAISS